MKQIFTFLAISFCTSLMLSAQVTIVSADIKPIGAVADQAADENPDASIQPGGDGELTWDFSALQNPGALTYSFLEPESTPYFDLFPNSNVGSEQGDNYFYFFQDESELTALGTYGEFNYQGSAIITSFTIEPGQSILRFPTNLNDSYDETVVQTAQTQGSTVGLPYDSVRIIRTVERSVTITAHGMVTTPYGTFDALRTTEAESATDEFYVLSFGNWSLFTTDGPNESTIYNWWSKEGNAGFPVVQLQANGSGEITGANWLTDFVSDAEEAFDLEFALYPNPAPHTLFVEMPERFEGSLQVMDLQGRMVSQQIVNGQKEEISTQNIAPGTYVLVVRNEAGKLAAAKRFQVVR